MQIVTVNVQYVPWGNIWSRKTVARKSLHVHILFSCSQLDGYTSLCILSVLESVR